MTRDYATLSNCYKPLPFRLADNGKGTKKEERLAASRKCGNGDQSRAPHALRQLRLETGITSATGSALVELGHTKVLCEVIGPSAAAAANINTTILNMEEGSLACEVNYVPNFGFPMASLVGSSASNLSENSQQPQQISAGRMNTKIGTIEKELSSQLLASISAAVPLRAYPKNLIMLRVTILQDDGSALSACTIAASLALVDASIEVYDMITSATVAVIMSDGKNDNKKSPPLLLADPTHDEISQADAVVQLSLLANWKEVTLWNQSGRLSSAVANDAMSLCRDGCRTMHKFMRSALLKQDLDVEMTEAGN